MEKDRDYIIALYDLYGNLLTEKQKNYFEDYYFMDLSLSEIAENYEISKNGVYDQLKRTVSALEDIEKAVGLYQRIKEIEALDIDKELKEKIIGILKE